VIPARNDTVEVGGEVLAPQSFRWEPGWGVRDYLARAGGLTDLGQRDTFLVYHRNGEISTNAQTAAVRPGDQILFLPYIRTNHLQVALDITEVITRTLLLSRAATFF
jgi:protein involved in polysaccharide export with SLBB domain